MQNKIIGANFQAPNIFDAVNNNPVMQFMPKEQFAQITGIKDIKSAEFNADYHRTKNLFYAQRVLGLQDATKDPSSIVPMPINFNELRRDTSTFNLYQNKDAWRTANDVISGRMEGRIIAFDTETIGDFLDPKEQIVSKLTQSEFLDPTGTNVGLRNELLNQIQSASMKADTAEAERLLGLKVAGITEIGIDSRSFGAGKRALRDPKASFFFGIDADQEAWLRRALDKKVNGQPLTSAELSGLERASRHSTIAHNGNAFSTFKQTWQGEEFTFVKSLNESRPDSIEDIASGITAMAREYNVNREHQISKVFGRINALASEEGTVIGGYNLDYDLRASRFYSQLHGTTGINSGTQYLDLMHAEQAYASANNTTVEEIRKSADPYITNQRLKSLEATVESRLETDTTFHMAYDDAAVTNDMLLYGKNNIVSKVQGIVDSAESSKVLDLDNSYLKINSRGLVRSQDILTINGFAAEEGESVANQYWEVVRSFNTTFDKLEIDVNGSSKVIKNTSDKVVLQLQNAMDSNMQLFKTFDTAEESVSWLTKHTSSISKDSADPIAQKAVHDLDVARRVIDQFFDPSSAGKNAGGFQGFKQYYSIYQDLANLSEEAVASMEALNRYGNTITTADELIANIGQNENLLKVLKYADENKINSVLGLLRRNAHTAQSSAEEAFAYSYKQSYILENIFGMFENNQEFFNYANEVLSDTTTNNLQKTIAFQMLQKDYMTFGNTSELHPNLGLMMTQADVNSVSIKTGANSFINLDITREDATFRLKNAFTEAGQKESATVQRIIDSLDDLTRRGFFTPQRQKELIETYGGDKAFSLAETIVQDLRNQTEEIRKLTPEEYSAQVEQARKFVGELNAEDPALKMLATKNHKSLAESATAEMANTVSNGALTEKFLNAAEKDIAKMQQSKLIEGYFKDGKEGLNEIVEELRKMNYDDDTIGQFKAMFYERGHGASNLGAFNRTVKDTSNMVKPIFFRSGESDASAFMFLTRDKDYAEAVKAFSNLDPDATASQVKQALDGLGSYIEIPYLTKIDVSDPSFAIDKAMKDVLGYGPTVTLVRQGDSYARYEGMRLNLFTGTDDAGRSVWRGGIRSAGGDYLLSPRIGMKSALEAISAGEYDIGTRSLNRVNQARMAESAAPLFGGHLVNGELKKVHKITTKDIDQAFRLQLEAAEGTYSEGLLSFIQDITVHAQETGKDNIGQNALVSLFKDFNAEFGITKSKKLNKGTVEAVARSEQFKQFYREYLTDKSGGIGSNEFIQRMIKNGDTSLAQVQDMSIFQIFAKAVQDNPMVDKDLATTIDLLANKVDMSPLVGETGSKHGQVSLWSNPARYNNNRIGGITRPTFLQRENYRPYDLEEGYFRDPEALTEMLGIHFGDTYTSTDYALRMQKAEAQLGIPDSYRNIVGAVRSISDTEIQAGRKAGQEWLLNTYTDLDPKVLTNAYNALMDDISLYEGKFYLNPVLANENFFAIGDPRTVRSSAVREVFKTGTKEEQIMTSSILTDLVQQGKQVTNGTLIGQRIGKDGSWVPIYYNGSTIQRLTERNVEDLVNTGKTQAIVTKQVEDIKLMIGEEKGTAKSIMYFSSIDPVEQAEQVKEAMRALGMKDYVTDSMTDNINELNKYMGAAFSAFDRNDLYGSTGYRTTVLLNNNINKHLTDMPIESRWLSIMNEFQGEEGLQDLLSIVGTKGNNALMWGDGSTFASHLSLGTNGEILFDNPIDTGATNVLDALTSRLERSNNVRAKSAINVINALSEGNAALAPIQRQYMNTFQSMGFNLDVRAHQAFSSLYDGDILTREEAIRYAEIKRTSIKEGVYDRTIGLGEPSAIRRTWSDTVRSRRGFLQPKYEEEMLAGINESIKFLQDGADVNSIAGKNILKLKAGDILSNIPNNGTDTEGYRNFIFKTDGEPSAFLQARAHYGTNNVDFNFKSSSYYLDLSDFGEIKYNGKKVSGILLPFQQIDTLADDVVVSRNSTNATVRFFNTLAENQANPNKDKIEAALAELFKAYKKEIDPSDKESLANAVGMRMKMPNATEVLASQAIAPTLDIDNEILQEYRSLQRAIAQDGSANNFVANADKIARLDALEGKIQRAKNAQKLRIVNSNNPIKELHLTGKKKYQNLIEGIDGTLETAMVVGKETFMRAEMDTGRIGYQLVKDYALNGEIVSYDAFDRFTRKSFQVFDTNDGIFELFNNVLDKYAGTEHADWAFRTRQGLENITNHRDAWRYFENQVNDRLLSINKNGVGTSIDDLGAAAIMAKQSRMDFMNTMHEGFESIGDEYASRVGLLAETGRYPFFTESGILTTKVFLDKSITGQTAIFLGPQFSILQNLDFDGDQEFLTFLGNAGLLPKNSEEYVLATKRFKLLNGMNKYSFANALDDALNSYNLNDTANFKAVLLKELDKAAYDTAKAEYIQSIGKEGAEQFSHLQDTTQDLLVNHSIQMKRMFTKFDEAFGSSTLNPAMVKAAVQANVLKEFIGNYSKPNLDIRDTLNYMLGFADDQEAARLTELRKGLFSIVQEVNPDIDVTGIKIGPTGILSITEQKGIDVKHVHAANTLNESTQWRLGVLELFKNANGAEKIVQEDREEALELLVRGSRRIFFNDTELTDKQIAQEILSKTYDEWAGLLKEADKDAREALQGRAYLSALYELSLHENAHQGYFGDFKKAASRDTLNLLDNMTEEEAEKFLKFAQEHPTIDTVTKATMVSAMQKYGTDEALMINDRSVQVGDIFLQRRAGTLTPQGKIFKGVRIEDGRVFADFTELDTKNLYNRTSIVSSIEAQGTSIKDLNKAIKENGGFLDFKRTDLNYDKNFNIRKIENLTQAEKDVISKQIASASVADVLDSYFELNREGKLAGFNLESQLSKNSRQYRAYANGRPLNEIIQRFVGTDSQALSARLTQIDEYLQYGIDNNFITGTNDSKELIRAINRQIAANPRKNIHRFEGDTPSELINNYLKDIEGVRLIDDSGWLEKGIGNVKLSNEIRESVADAINQQNQQIENIADTFYKNITENIAEDVAFEEARTAYEQAINSATADVFKTIRTSSSPEQEMFDLFNWNAFKTNQDFNLGTLNGTMKQGNFSKELLKAKVGFGEYINTSFEDLTQLQANRILNTNIDDIIAMYGDDSLEVLAAKNTKTLLSQMRGFDATIRTYDFASADTLRETYKLLHREEQNAANATAEQAINAARQAANGTGESIGKKTLTGEFRNFLEGLSDQTRKNIKTGGMVLAGTAIAGIAGHALFNRKSEDVEVPYQVEKELQPAIKEANVPKRIVKNKNNLSYPNEEGQAEEVYPKKKHKLAPPSLPKRRNIYHDAASGFDFKVSAQSKQKLEEESYRRMAAATGMNNSSLHVTRDNSKITDNWLQNKFAELTE